MEDVLGSPGTATIERAPRGEDTRQPEAITRTRYIQLVNLASKACDWLQDNGLKQGEACRFRQLMEALWFLKK